MVVPPLVEQERIVAILDDAFAAITTATANAEKNLANAQELFERYLQDVFAREGAEWSVRRLGELSELQSGGTPLRSNQEFWNGEIAWYSSGELDSAFTAQPERRITQDGLSESSAKLFPKGSLLIGMYDTAALKMSILDRDAAFNQAIVGVKPNQGVDLRFVRYFIEANRQQILQLRRGVRQKNLSLTKVRNIAIAVPPLKVQRSVVSRLADLGEEVSQLEASYGSILRHLAELKQSILHRAFIGKLPTDPKATDRALAEAAL